jgi:hypothetical protein
VREGCDCEADSLGGDVIAAFSARRWLSKARSEVSNSVCDSYMLISCVGIKVTEVDIPWPAGLIP